MSQENVENLRLAFDAFKRRDTSNTAGTARGPPRATAGHGAGARDRPGCGGSVPLRAVPCSAIPRPADHEGDPGKVAGSV